MPHVQSALAEADRRELGWERRLRGLADAVPILISYVTRSLRYQFNNAAYGAWFGVDIESIRGRSMREVLGSDAFEQMRPYVAKALAGQPVSVDTLVNYSTGTRFVNLQLLPDRVGADVVGFWSLITDSTDRKQLEEKLGGAERLANVGQVAAGIAHDLRNVLSSIQGAVEMVRHPPRSDAKRKDPLLAIEQAVQCGANIARDLSQLGELQEETPPVEVDHVLAKNELLLQLLLGEKVRLRVALGAPGTRIRCTEGQLAQLIMNFAINSRHAMPDGGSFAVRTRPVTRLPTCGSLKPTRFVEVVLTDTGCGMNEATRARIFERFFTTRAPGEGTGLGLAVASGIVKACRGSIEVETHPGRGTAFRILLPAVP